MGWLSDLFQTQKRRFDDLLPFLDSVLQALPDEYGFLRDQVRAGVVVGLERNRVMGEGWYTTLLRDEVLDQSDRVRVSINIDGLCASCGESTLDCGLTVVDGLVISLFCSDGERAACNDCRPSARLMTVTPFENWDMRDLRRILGEVGPDDLQILDWQRTFAVTVNGMRYWMVKDCGDGEFYAVDVSGRGFHIRHDRADIVEVAPSVQALIELLRKGHEPGRC